MPILKELDYACCGCSVRAVSRFLFFLGVFCGVLYVLQNRVAPYETQEERAELAKFIQEAFGRTPEEAARMAKEWIEIMNKARIAGLTSSIINIICCGLALHGSYKGRARFIVPYLVLNGIGLISVAVCIVLFVILGFFIPALFVLAIVFLIFFGTSYYLYLVVWTHYREIKNGEHAPGTMKYSV